MFLTLFQLIFVFFSIRFFSIVIHELGHYLAVRVNSLVTKEVCIGVSDGENARKLKLFTYNNTDFYLGPHMFFTGYIILGDQVDLTDNQDFNISLAGPLTNAILAILSMAFAGYLINGKVLLPIVATIVLLITSPAHKLIFLILAGIMCTVTTFTVIWSLTLPVSSAPQTGDLPNLLSSFLELKYILVLIGLININAFGASTSIQDPEDEGYSDGLSVLLSSSLSKNSKRKIGLACHHLDLASKKIEKIVLCISLVSILICLGGIYMHWYQLR